MKNRDQIDLAAWEFFWKRTKKEVNDEGTRPDMIIGYREGYEEAIRDFKASFVVPEALSKPFKDKSVWQTIKERELLKEKPTLYCGKHNVACNEDKLCPKCLEESNK